MLESLFCHFLLIVVDMIDDVGM